MVFSRVVDIDGRRAGIRRIVFQILIEKGKQDVAANVCSRVFIPEERTERAAVRIDLAMPPRSDDQVVHVVARAAKLMVDLAGASPADGAYPVAIVAISGSEKSDRLAGSPEVKVSVG